MEETSKFKFITLNESLLVSSKEVSQNQIVNYLKDTYKVLQQKQDTFLLEDINNKFAEIKDKLVVIKNDDVYKTKNERNLLNLLIDNCNLNKFLPDLLILDSNSQGEVDFDLRDIKLEYEIKNLIDFYQKILVRNNVIEDDYSAKYSQYREDILDLINKVSFAFFKTFGLNFDIEEFFDAYLNLFTGRKKLNLPNGIDSDSSEIFSQEYSSESGGTKYFSFREGRNTEWKVSEEEKEELFKKWFEKKLKQYGVPVPPPEDKYPKLHNAWVNQTTKDLPKIYSGFDKDSPSIKVLHPLYYFYLPECRELWSKAEKEFFNQYSLRENFIQDNYNKSDIDDLNFDKSGKNQPSGFVYLIRNQDIFKIGITENLLNRMSQLEPDEIIDVIKCSNFREVEKDLHREYKDYRIPQTEYFRLSEKQVLEVSRKLKSMAK